ncbi:MAG TPA: DUF2785 domain-containing protein [Nocardioidaceae bacterium]|nr:DUF2785 domain-containing protein [Nocardioidaceae bacterium]
MEVMESAFWEQVAADGHRVPTERSLSELTAELTSMLGDPDPYIRDDIALGTLTTWIREGVYDDLLEGLGDGMAAGLVIGLGTTSSDTVFRRSCSCVVLTECVQRDNEVRLMSPDTILRWGDRVMSWLVRERDLRAFVPGKGWAHTLAHGAEALRALALSEAIGRLELTVLLDVVADRLCEPTDFRLGYGEEDRLASATLTMIRRDILPMDVLDPWVSRLVEAASAQREGDPPAAPRNVQAYLRALHLQLALAPDPPTCRADLLLSLISGLKRSNPVLRGESWR